MAPHELLEAFVSQGAARELQVVKGEGLLWERALRFPFQPAGAWTSVHTTRTMNMGLCRSNPCPKLGHRLVGRSIEALWREIFGPQHELKHDAAGPTEGNDEGL